MLRGGWGAYRFVTQVNDVAAALVTAQHVLGYNLPGGKNVMLSQLSQLAYKPCTQYCGSGSQTGFDPSDYGQPLTTAYNFTVDQRLKWNSLFDIAYVGSNTSQLSINSEGIEGSNFAALADQNKTPVGALFKPDPVTGVLSTNPENLAVNPNFTTLTGTATGNSYSDYHPYGYAYGTNSVYVNRGLSYTNYNALQVAWIKTSGRLGYNLNATWSKTLGTGLQENPYDVRLNYGPTSVDRPFVFNASYYYQTGNIHMFNSFVNGTLSGWTISGISTWQAGGYIPSALGNGVPNFGLGMSYTTAVCRARRLNRRPWDSRMDSVVKRTLARTPLFRSCLCLPAIQPASRPLPARQWKLLQCACDRAAGRTGLPYMSAGAYFNNDLAIYRSFRIPATRGSKSSSGPVPSTG